MSRLTAISLVALAAALVAGGAAVADSKKQRSDSDFGLQYDENGVPIVVRVGRYGPYLERILPLPSDAKPDAEPKVQRANLPESMTPDELNPTYIIPSVFHPDVADTVAVAIAGEGKTSAGATGPIKVGSRSTAAPVDETGTLPRVR